MNIETPDPQAPPGTARRWVAAQVVEVEDGDRWVWCHSRSLLFASGRVCLDNHLHGASNYARVSRWHRWNPGEAGSRGTTTSSGSVRGSRTVSRRAHRPLPRPPRAATAGVDLDRTGFVMLGKVAHAGRSASADLAEQMGLDISTVSRKAQQLESAGLVERTGDPDDRRAAMLSIAVAGQAHAGADAPRALAGDRRADRRLAGRGSDAIRRSAGALFAADAERDREVAA